MANIAFWGTVHGQVATTTNIITAAHYSTLEYDVKALLTQTHWSHSTLEKSITKENSSNTFFNDTGIDALERLARSNRLTAKAIPDYTESIMSDRLDLLPGTTKKDESLFANVEDVMSKIMTVAKNEYDFSFFDINSGTQNELSKIVLNHADLVVVNLNQNKHVLDRFFNKEDYVSALDQKPYIIVISQYDEQSRMTLKNIKRKYKVNVPIVGIPYCSQLRDAMNENRMTEFLIRSHNSTKKHHDYKFRQSALKLVNLIYKLSQKKTETIQGAS
ncbi:MULTISPECIES: P-loop NTPase family protein [Alkalihalophilus]|uniref:AAA domain-containing protein n=1 Tax=Alkalihalophilus pseudofirmus (strain ATCC BAA-2126 / JCM 17055 / OF4) TaxID=398511 RepID=D3G1J2_ALKPO|nr:MULTISPECIES: hypothetical protein [Alkalihalophilus]ADC52218.1 hypothetical protein BpOF4_21114 [Alkalihalophilus pseudofirmus OF4]MEC2074167.1 hypothetical protein [Alkalihalophilus marmarensis]